MLRNQNIKDFPYNLVCIGNDDLQFNSFIKRTKNSFLIKRLIQVSASGSCIAKTINKYFMFDWSSSLHTVEYWFMYAPMYTCMPNVHTIIDSGVTGGGKVKILPTNLTQKHCHAPIHFTSLYVLNVDTLGGSPPKTTPRECSNMIGYDRSWLSLGGKRRSTFLHTNVL